MRNRGDLRKESNGRLRVDKIALIMISALLALTLSSCSKPRTISGTWEKLD